MCGRYNLRTTPAELAEVFGVAAATAPQQLLLRYNIAPTQSVVAIRQQESDHTTQREVTVLQWGLIPSWSKDPKIGSRMINARSETAAEKPSFRAAFKRRRCLIPASGFYEWDQHTQPKQPYHITPTRGGLMAFAGLWERWSPPGSEPLETCTILTTGATGTLSPIHDRMPVILPPEQFDQWLNAESPADKLQSLLLPATEDLLELTPISTTVNNVRHAGPECIEPLAKM
ncbi:MAG: SOS response-associated peptidase [Planctomycetaceae bacterium]